MGLSDDLPLPRRPLFLPVVIATIFLTVIGMSAGIALGARHQRQVEARQEEPAPAPAPVATTTAPAERCRSETYAVARQHGAEGELTRMLLVRTKSSVVWICRDDAGRLFYHGNRGGEDARWIEGQTALFMTDVHRSGDEYSVTAADGTIFSVDRRRLYIVHKDGTPETQLAIN